MSPPSVCCVPSLVVCPAPPPEEKFDLDATTEGATTWEVSARKSSATRTHRGPRQKGTIRCSPANPANPEIPTLGYPEPVQEESSSSPIIIKADRVNFEDGNIRLFVRADSFLLHEYQLAGFSVLKKMIHDARKDKGEPSASDRTCSPVELHLDEDPNEFDNMHKILYLNVYDKLSPKNHSDSILKSTLRLATKLQYPALRSYAIQCLEGKKMTPIERISLAREANVSSWHEEGISELCSRDQPITIAEAKVLGMETFVSLVSRREARKLNRKPKTPPPSPKDIPRQDSSDRRSPTPGSPRRSSRLNPAKRRAEPYPSRRVSSR